jgi:hypothetical protein
MYVKLALNMNSGKTMAEMGSRSKQLYKPIKRDIADLKMNLCFYFLPRYKRALGALK